MSRAARLALPILLIGAIAGPIALAEAETERSSPLQLITAEEADQPINTMVGRRIEPLDAGPSIRIESPKQGESFEGPISVHVVFGPGKSGLPVDMGSLKLEYQRAWGIDITSRVREYIEGQEIRIAEAALPGGRHSVEIRIEDTQSNVSTQLFTVVVKD